MVVAHGGTRAGRKNVADNDGDERKNCVSSTLTALGTTVKFHVEHHASSPPLSYNFTTTPRLFIHKFSLIPYMQLTI